MNVRNLGLTLMLIAVAATGSAQNTTPLPVPSPIQYDPVACIRADEVPVLQMNVLEEGELWGYFRIVGTTDWCAVEGFNRGPLSTVRLPRFQDKTELEYFFLLQDGNRVIGRSPRIYRVTVKELCDTLIARNMIIVPMMCAQTANSIPASMGAGYALRATTLGDGSPFRPGEQ